ncbi:MAG TPA: hypothetical protein VHX88_03385 [Solirubrobacteraceae bacterium]|jgi:hypothetical protein|nr:hypothetical protein [Solirubrobacteraceae bacterium]
MRQLRLLAAFVWDFVVGDDWITAVGVVVAVAGTALLADATHSDWWTLPLAVVVLLSWSLWRVVCPRSED